MFQFKVNQKIIYTKDNSEKLAWFLTIYAIFVKKEKHTITHMFITCTHVALFWNEVFAWWSQNINENIH